MLRFGRRCQGFKSSCVHPPTWGLSYRPSTIHQFRFARCLGFQSRGSPRPCPRTRLCPSGVVNYHVALSRHRRGFESRLGRSWCWLHTRNPHHYHLCRVSLVRSIIPLCHGGDTGSNPVLGVGTAPPPIPFLHRVRYLHRSCLYRRTWFQRHTRIVTNYLGTGTKIERRGEPFLNPLPLPLVVTPCGVSGSHTLGRIVQVGQNIPLLTEKSAVQIRLRPFRESSSVRPERHS